jgi:uncharacterized protein (TIGR03790 family)
VLVAINELSPASVEIGDYYIRKRSVADDHVIRLKTAVTDSIHRAEYERTIETPLANWLTSHGLQDKILYVVLTKGVPLRIAGTEGAGGTTASVDSELTLLYRRMLSLPVATTGKLDNPYYLGEKATADGLPFTRFNYDIYLVTRLDGFTVEDVKGLIDRAAAPVRDGKVVLDERATLNDPGGDIWLQGAADRLRAVDPSRVVLETTRTVATSTEPLMGYYSWGSNDPANRLRRFGFSFVNGALAAMFVSTDGRSFREPPADWLPGGADQRGYGSQSLAGDLIRDGVTGVAAHVSEPLLSATVRPQILFPVYLGGLNLAEAFYSAMPYLSWQSLVIGDPLCAPFRRAIVPPDKLYRGLDSSTDMPGLFAERRLAVLSRTGLKPDALKLSMKAEVQLARGAKPEYQRLLLQATELEPRMSGANLQLGMLFDESGDHQQAIERYRKVVAIDANNAAALNNLAYAMAVYGHTPKEALPLAERAYQLAPSPVVADTVGWIQHLLGDDRAAAPYMEKAVTGAPDNVEVLIHAATVHAVLRDVARARREYEAAQKLDPRLDERPEVKALKELLKGGWL